MGRSAYTKARATPVVAHRRVACCDRSVIRVFAQGPAELALARLLSSARSHFSATVEVLDAPPPPVTSATLRLDSTSAGYAGDFRVSVRMASAADYAAADRAELAGRAAGMASLARRCPSVWEVSGTDDRPWERDAALLNLCAILASVALGPVLPSDASTLFGVRGAMERVEAVLGRRSLQR
jgi:hypothetical protein